MTDHEWAEWMALNRQCWDERAFSACGDCTVGFSAEMRDIGLCDGFPGRQPGKPLARNAISLLVVLRTLGMSQSAISRTLDIPLSTVHAHLTGRNAMIPLGVRRQRAAERQRQAAAMKKDGHTTAHIARTLGVSRSMARRFLRRDAA
jgi:DNA-binding CsgD family transcriptional regulator